MKSPWLRYLDPRYFELRHLNWMAWCNILLAVLALLPCVAVTTFVFQPHLLQLGSRHAISAEQLGRLTDAARLRQMLSEEVHFGGVMLTDDAHMLGSIALVLFWLALLLPVNAVYLRRAYALQKARPESTPKAP